MRTIARNNPSKKCKLSGCDGATLAKGVCNKHYKRIRIHKDYNKVTVDYDGRSRHELLFTYKNMKRRCYGKSHKAYKNYGGRGIRVCERWLNDFWAFVEDMGERPSDKHSLDRIDNDGDYTPDNCRWATKVEQMNNTRANRLITHNGRTMTLENWGRQFGITGLTIHKRLKSGWNLDKALTAPLKNNRLGHKNKSYKNYS